ncbi:hypothetical protein BDV93DRAFT_607987 [Ceratobasidium sp. AG-I]|nr:hypothetical protein BDV93DRAFT_607987 [Ceratobasidium sp. AG-I]
MIIIPVLALSALFKLANPDVTLHVSRATSDISVGHSGAEYEVGLEYLSVSQGFMISQLSLPGQSPLLSERALQFGSPVGPSLCSVPLSTSASTPTPTSTRMFSPTSRAVTHASDSLNYHKFTTLSGAICRLLASKVPSTGLSSSSLSSLSSFPSTPSPLLSTPDFYLHGSFNTTSALDSTALPTYGPEWEWSPRDLVVYVAQPSCPVPVLRSDMSTLPTLHRCTPGSRDYYADVVRVAMLKQTCIVPRLDWCGRDSEGLQASLELTSRKFLELVIALIRERELAQVAVVHGYERASQPIALLFSALVVCYGLFIYTVGNVMDLQYEEEVVFDARESLLCKPIELPILPASQARSCDLVSADDSNEMSVKHDITLYPICIVALTVVYALFICVLCDVLDSKKQKENTLGQPTELCESVETDIPTTSEAGSGDSGPANSLNESSSNDTVSCPPTSLADSVQSTTPEPNRHTLEIEANSEVLQSEQDGQDNQSLREEEQENDEQESLARPLPPHSALTSSSFSIPEHSDITPGTTVAARPDDSLDPEAEAQDRPEEDVATAELAHESSVDLEQKGLEEEEEMEEEGINAEKDPQDEAIPLEVECEEDSTETESPLPPCLEPESSLPCLSEWFDEKATAVAGSSSAKALDWSDSKFEKNDEVALLEQEEQCDQALLEEQARQGREQEEREREGKRWEEKLAEIKLKMEEERAEARRVAEAAAPNGGGSGGGLVAVQANSGSVTNTSEERWETVGQRRNGRGSNRTLQGSGGSGSGGKRAPRRA